MSLRDRLRSKKETKAETIETSVKSKSDEQKCEFKLSINKVTKAVKNVKSASDLGKIVKEFSKFLETLATDDANITFSGNFDMGQRMLLNCILANFLDEGETATKEEVIEVKEEPAKTTEEPPKEEPKLIRRRRSMKSRTEESSTEI